MILRTITRTMIVTLCAGMILLFAGDASSAKPYHAQGVTSITGEVNMINANAISISVDMKSDGNIDADMVFLIDEDVAFQKKELSEIQNGDVVKVTYENHTELDAEGNEKFVKRVTKKIHYLRAKSKSLSSGKK